MVSEVTHPATDAILNHDHYPSILVGLSPDLGASLVFRRSVAHDKKRCSFMVTFEFMGRLLSII